MHASHAPSSGTPGMNCSGVVMAPRVTTVRGCALPRDLAQAFGRAIEEHHVDLAVLRHHLLHLRLVERQQAGMFRRIELGAAIDGDVVLVEPVEIVGRKVDAGRDPLLAKRAHHVAEDVLAEGRVRDAVGRRFRGPHREAGVVLGGEDDVPDARQFREHGPILGIELARVERLRQLGEEAARVIVGRAGQRVADHRAELAVDAPVDEEAEALVAEPFEPVGLVALDAGAAGGVALRGERAGGGKEE